MHNPCVIIRFLQLLAAISYGIGSMWLLCCFSLMLFATPFAIYFKPDDIKTRKIAFYVYAVLTGCEVIGMFIMIVFIFNGSWALTICNDFT